jgi:SAM-dependent methyltransferase
MLENKKQNVRQFYMGNKGIDYHTKHSRDPYIQNLVSQERARKLQRFIVPDDTILEFGVGTGINLLGIKCKNRVGYDVSDAGREICTSAGIEFITDIASIKGEQFSLVLCHHVLEHVPDPYEVLEQIWQFLLPGGKLLLCVPFETSQYHHHFQLKDVDQHLYSWNVLTLGNLVTSVGFAVNDANVNPFGYEQRLAFLANYGLQTYHLGLWMLRKLMPADEILLLATKN